MNNQIEVFDAIIKNAQQKDAESVVMLRRIISMMINDEDNFPDHAVIKIALCLKSTIIEISQIEIGMN